jgi:hypothetical protein
MRLVGKEQSIHPAFGVECEQGCKCKQAFMVDQVKELLTATEGERKRF